MNNVKCLQCGLINFTDSNACKRCDFSFANAQSTTPNRETLTTWQTNRCVRPAVQTSSGQPSFINIVKNDYGALIGASMPLVTWGMFIATKVFGFSFGRRGRELRVDESDSTFLYIAIAGTILGIALLAWRVYFFQQTFAGGEDVMGRITSVWFFKDRGRIEYSYTVNNQTFQSGNAIMKNKQTQSFQDGDEIELVVNRLNPNRAFVKALYC